VCVFVCGVGECAFVCVMGVCVVWASVRLFVCACVCVYVCVVQASVRLSVCVYYRKKINIFFWQNVGVLGYEYFWYLQKTADHESYLKRLLILSPPTINCVPSVKIPKQKRGNWKENL